MSDIFPDKFPPMYRVIHVPAEKSGVVVLDPEGARLGVYPTRAAAIQGAWKYFLNRLSYGGVALLLTRLFSQEDEASTQLESLKEREDRIRTLVEASALASNNLLNCLGEAVTTPDSSRPSTEAPVETPPEVTVPLVEVKPYDPEFDYGGIIPPDILPKGFTIEKSDDRRALPFLASAPDGWRLACFTREDAHLKAWSYVRLKNGESGAPPSRPGATATRPPPSPGASKLPPGYQHSYNDKVYLKHKLSYPARGYRRFYSYAAASDAAWNDYRSENPPDAAQDLSDVAETYDSLDLPEGFKEKYLGPGRPNPYELTLPSGLVQCYATPAELARAARELDKERVKDARVTGAQISEHAPPLYIFDYDFRKPRSWSMKTPDGKTIDYQSRRARLHAAWVHHNAAVGDKFEAIRGMEDFPASFEMKLPEGYSMNQSSVGYMPWRLQKPKGYSQFFSAEALALKSAWEHWRVERNKAEDANEDKDKEKVGQDSKFLVALKAAHGTQSK